MPLLVTWSPKVKFNSCLHPYSPEGRFSSPIRGLKASSLPLGTPACRGGGGCSIRKTSPSHPLLLSERFFLFFLAFFLLFFFAFFALLLRCRWRLPFFFFFFFFFSLLCLAFVLLVVLLLVPLGRTAFIP